MRVFIAIHLPETLGIELGRRQAEFRSMLARHSSRKSGDARVQWVRPEGTHLTLKFLGEVPAASLDRLIAALAPLGAFPRFSVEVRGFGFFPNARRPQVFWAGVLAPPALAGLAARIDAETAKLGFPPEKRAFTPHLTLARFRTPGPQPELEVMARESGARTMGQFEVCRFFLFESKLQAGKPAEYRKIASFPTL